MSDSDADDALAAVPSFSTGATFLDANSQAHHKPLSAFGDLTDNARDADATKLDIDVVKNASDGRLTITMTDNGKGMSEHRLRTGIGGIAHSDKSHRAAMRERRRAFDSSRTLPVDRKYCARAMTNSCAGTSLTVLGAFLVAIFLSSAARKDGSRASSIEHITIDH